MQLENSASIISNCWNEILHNFQCYFARNYY
ncbi:hypothetical protein T11_8492 [Trichinella zimbabwensis]|uniref:Uncharacterized protein n=1 Tax=Trichinella zimbabwensis TaxID=268475 RepID=A0A0V1DTB1_9BILA|nr:hypothetical protein T11_8492 [Trichinella zimbabwensis]